MTGTSAITQGCFYIQSRRIPPQEAFHYAQEYAFVPLLVRCGDHHPRRQDGLACQLEKNHDVPHSCVDSTVLYQWYEDKAIEGVPSKLDVEKLRADLAKVTAERDMFRTAAEDALHQIHTQSMLDANTSKVRDILARALGTNPLLRL